MTIHDSELDLDLDLDDSELELDISDSTRSLSAEPQRDEDMVPLSPEEALDLLEQLIGEDPRKATQSTSGIRAYQSSGRLTRMSDVGSIGSPDDPTVVEGAPIGSSGLDDE